MLNLENACYHSYTFFQRPIFYLETYIVLLNLHKEFTGLIGRKSINKGRLLPVILYGYETWYLTV
jgi:hypothetical protein